MMTAIWQQAQKELSGLGVNDRPSFSGHMVIPASAIGSNVLRCLSYQAFFILRIALRKSFFFNSKVCFREAVMDFEFYFYGVYGTLS